jgi:hypothetical protein
VAIPYQECVASDEYGDAPERTDRTRRVDCALAAGERLVGRGEGWLKPLLVAAAINGGLISFAIGAAGFGAVLQDYFG